MIFRITNLIITLIFMDKDKKPKPKFDFSKKKKIGLINLLFLVILFGVFIFSANFFSEGVEVKKEEEKSFSHLVSEIREGNVSKITLSEDKSSLKVEVFENESKNRTETKTLVFPNISTANSSVLENLKNSLGEENLNIGTGDGQIIYVEEPKSFLTKLFESSIFTILIYILLFVLVALFIIKKMGDVGSKNMSFANSKAKLFDANNKIKVSFDDVAGNEEAKTELTEVVDFLKRPKDFIEMGAKIPHGVLLVGSPGNGKTLMAKAVAGEAGVPFFYVSGSEFVEMFVGVGAGRVRDLFKQAKAKGSSVIFIDEIDAVGRKRGSGLGNSNDEREQTLNQILVEMDGFENTDSVIVIAATNRPDVLDPALLRPGRFDRQVEVVAPDVKEREKILEVHIKGKKIAKDVDLSIIAKRTAGFSGADLMNVLNESAILAVREKKKEVDNETLREAIEKVMLGPSLKSKVVTEEDKKKTALHEAGHAIVATVLPNANKVQKITIIPRGKAGGYTFTVDSKDPTYVSKSKFLDEISVLYGGYVVEEMYFGEVSTGPSNDLQRATQMARNMVVKYGMSNLGPISFNEDNGPSYLGRDLMEKKHFSENTGSVIDQEIERILIEAYQKTKKIIQKHKKELETVSDLLMEKETLEMEEYNQITSHIANPKILEEEK